MTIYASISKKVEPISTNTFYLDFNVQARNDSGTITGYEFYRNGILDANNTYSILNPSPNYSGNVSIIETQSGDINYEIKFLGSGSQIARANTSITLDNIPPLIKKFELFDIEKLADDSYDVTLEIEIEDNLKIHKYAITNDYDNQTSNVYPEFFGSGLQELYSKTFPPGHSGNTKFEIVSWDDAGWESNKGETYVEISSTPPIISSFDIENPQLNQASNEFVLSANIVGTTTQSIIQYYAGTTNTPTFISLDPSEFQSGSFSISKPFTVANNILSGMITLYSAVKDYSGNETLYSINYELDRTPPHSGSVDVVNIHKQGNQYYGDIVLKAKDNKGIAKFGWAIDNDNPATSYTVSPPANNFANTITNQFLGYAGSQANTIYAKFRDESGNKTKETISKTLLIDGTIPNTSMSLASTEKTGTGDYRLTLDVSAADNHNIIKERFFAKNLVSNNIIGSNTYSLVIPESRFISEQKSILIPNTEVEGELELYWQVWDSFGNESVSSTVLIDFDKTAPLITKFEYLRVEKGTNSYRLFSELAANDSIGVIDYRIAFDDVSSAPWIEIVANTEIQETIFADFPVSELGNTKNMIVEVRDKLQNISANSVIEVTPDDCSIIGTASIVNGNFDSTNFLIDFKLDAQNNKPNGNVNFYSVVTSSPNIKDWKPLPTQNNNPSEVVTVAVPRSATGVQDFYISFKDLWENESPVIPLQFALDESGLQIAGIEVIDVELNASNNYVANLHFYAIDNKVVTKYDFSDDSGITDIPTPVKEFHEYRQVHLATITDPPGQKLYSISYFDGFGNESDVKNLYFPTGSGNPLYFEKNSPNVSINYVDTNVVGLNYEMKFTMRAEDETKLKDYKFWFVDDTEPISYTAYPANAGKSHTISETFNVPIGSNNNPEFKVKVRDFFENETANSVFEPINDTAPDTPILNVNTSNYKESGTELVIDYNARAATGSKIRQLLVQVDNTTTPLEDFFLPRTTDPAHPNGIFNTEWANGTFSFTFPHSYNPGTVHVRSISNYQIESSANSISETFDLTPPTNTSVSHVSSYNNQTEYVVRVKVHAEDHECGVANVHIRPSYDSSKLWWFSQKDASGQFPKVLDKEVSFDVDSSFAGPTFDVDVRFENLRGSQSLWIACNNIDIDKTKPSIANAVFNNNISFSSPLNYPGANTLSVPFRFDAFDFSRIKQYKISKSIDPNDAPTSASNWSVPRLTTQQKESVNKSIDLSDYGFTDGFNQINIHVKDELGNIATDSIDFELDQTSPSASLAPRTDANTGFREVQRLQIGATDYFVIPYDVKYNDNYSGANTRTKWIEDEFGNLINIPTQDEAIPSPTENYTGNTSQRIPSGNLGEVFFREYVTDRFYNQSANTSGSDTFSLYLKTDIPTITKFEQASGSAYTNNSNVLTKIEANTNRIHPIKDDIELSNYVISTNPNLIWNSPEWTANTKITATHNYIATKRIDLDTIGFSEGVCNVYCYVKDACQNIANSMFSIIYDKTAPAIHKFDKNSHSRSHSTYDIHLEADVSDLNSGIKEYVISQSSGDTNFISIAANTSANTFLTKTIQIPLSDDGHKIFYLRVKDAAGNLSEANTGFFIDGVTPIAGSFEPTSSYSKYYLSTARNEFMFDVSDDSSLKEVRYELNGNTYNLNTYANTTSDSNTFNADFSSLSEGIYRIYLEVEDTFENEARIPYEFYFDNDPPTISNFTIKEIRPNQEVGAAANSYTVEFSISANDAVRVNEYMLFEDGNLIETIPLQAVSFTASPTIKTEINSADETKDFKLTVFDLAGNETSKTITQRVSNGAATVIDTFSVLSSTISDMTFDYSANSVIDFKEVSITTRDTLDYDDSFWNSMGAANSVSTTVTKAYSEVNLLPLANQEFYLHLKDICGNQIKDNVTFTVASSSPRIENLTPKIQLEKKGNFYIGTISFDVPAGSNKIIGYSISMTKDSEKFKSIMPMSPGDSLTQQFKIPTSQMNNDEETLYVRLLNELGEKSSNYRVSVNAKKHNMEKFEVCASEHMSGSTNQVDILFDTENDPYNMKYAFVVDNSSRPVDAAFISPTITTNSIGEFLFDFNVDVSTKMIGDHKLWVWLKTTQNEYSFRTHDFRSEPSTTPPTVSLSVIKSYVYKDKKLVYVELQATDLGIGISEVSIIESGTHTFKTIPTTNFKKHIEVFEYPKTRNDSITYTGAAKDASGNQSVNTTTILDLSSII